MIMFLNGDSAEDREQRIRRHAETEPLLALVLAAVHVEWTIRRACIALGHLPNAIIRKRLRKCSGLRRLNEEWINITQNPSLNSIVGEEHWLQLTKVSDLRNKLVHGERTASLPYARELVPAALLAAETVRAFASRRGIDLYQRLPVRKQRVGKGTIKGHKLKDDGYLQKLIVQEDGGGDFDCDVSTVSTRRRLHPHANFREGQRIVFGYSGRSNRNCPENASFLRMDEPS